MNLTPNQLSILQHATGSDSFGKISNHTIRNYFVAGPKTPDFIDCEAMVAAGLMTSDGASRLCAGDHMFHVTPFGKVTMKAQSPKEPEKTRSEARYALYLKQTTGETFLEWMKAHKEKYGVSP